MPMIINGLTLIVILTKMDWFVNRKITVRNIALQNTEIFILAFILKQYLKYIIIYIFFKFLLFE
jgi:hypothetical protein